MIDLIIINDEIAKHYPDMKKAFSVQFSAIDFEKIKHQLQWSVNETELKRALHRLHCLLQLTQGQYQAQEFEVFTKLESPITESLLALIILDACKRCQEAIMAFESSGKTALKDTVAFFFDTLAQVPEIYPLFNAIDPKSQEYLRAHIFYLHQRHLQFGEVPPTSLHDFLKFIQTEEQHKVEKRLQLQNLFWMLNLMGFDLPNTQLNQKKCEFGPTMSPQRLFQLQDIQKNLQKCIEQKSLEPLQSYYANIIPASLASKLQNLELKTSVFVGRIILLLQDKLGKEESEKILDDLVMQHLPLLDSAAAEEAICFKKLELQAITFLPAVFWKLYENKGDKTSSEIVVIYIKLQQALYKSLVQVQDSLQQNRSIPLFSLSQNVDFLKDFIRYPDYDIRLDLKISQFITLNSRLVSPQAVPVEKKEIEDLIKPAQDSQNPTLSTYRF